MIEHRGELRIEIEGDAGCESIENEAGDVSLGDVGSGAVVVVAEPSNMK